MFTKILYINLDRRNDRKEHIETQLKKINWNGKVERVSAFDGRKLSDKDLINLLDKEAINEFIDTNDRTFAPGSYMSKGAAGCALSHRKCWENILYNDDKKVLILEDDIFFDDNFNDKLKDYLLQVPDYDLLYIGFHEARGSQQYNNILKKPENVVFGLFGYIIDKKIAKTLLDMYPIRSQIDSEILKIYNNIKVYHLNENLRIIHSDHSYYNNFGTDIQYIEKFNNIKENNIKENNDYIIYFLIFIILYFIISKSMK
jgi:GR25 family glycosyltransferase involved in LPS biosynthesis